jgi:hypothetical protein
MRDRWEKCKLGSFFLFFLLLVLELVQAVGLLNPGGSLSFALLDELPPLPTLPVALQNGLFPLPLLLDLREVPPQVVELVRDPLQLFL